MKNILLVCSAGMSTSLLVTKMEAAAKTRGIDCHIEAVAEADAINKVDNIDVLLLGPQVRFLLKKFQGLTEGKNVPVEVIETIAYGTMNGDKVLTRALELIG